MTTYENLAPSSNVWIYTSEREFTFEEKEIIQQKASAFIAEWESHGQAVKGFFEIKYNQFIFIYADDQGDKLCGRAMDGSIRLIKELEKELNISLLDRMLLAYKKDKKTITTTFPDFQQKIANGEITENTTVFNCILTKKLELENWETAAKNSWHKQLF